MEDLKDIIGRDEIFTFENASDRIDLIHGQLGKVGERAFPDILSFPIRLSEQDGRFGVPIGHDIDMHGYYIRHHAIDVKLNMALYMATLCMLKMLFIHCNCLK